MSGGLDVFAVRDARPELFRTAGTEWRRFADRLRARVSELATGVQAPLAGGQAWTGHAQEAAAARLDTYLRQLRLAEQESRTVAAVLAGAADAFDLAHDQVVSLLAEAARAGCRVQADGGVTPAPLTVAERHADDPASVLAHRRRQAEGYAKALKVALGDAVDADARAAAALRRFAASAADPDSFQVLLDRLAGAALAAELSRADIPRVGTDPAAVHAWWSRLDEETRQRLVAHFPDLVGPLDGVPARWRHRANVANLAQAEARLRGELAGLLAERGRLAGILDPYDDNPYPEGADRELTARIVALQEKLAGIEQLRSRIGTGEPDERTGLFLLKFAPDGNGRVIGSFGNPDTARHVAVQVPGTTARLGAIDDEVLRAQRLWEATRRHGNGSVASVFWLDYDAPQSLYLDATRAGFATDGAPALNGFLHGLRSTHEGPSSHNTVIGHSYGSTLIGVTAEQHHGLPVDDTVVLGSPGMRVDRVEQLGISRQHFYAGLAEGGEILNARDPVVTMSDPNGPGTGLRVGRETELWHGTNPAADRFGGQRLEVGPGNHSSYWNTDDGRLDNLGAVVSGDQVTLRPGLPE